MSDEQIAELSAKVSRLEDLVVSILDTIKKSGKPRDAPRFHTLEGIKSNCAIEDACWIWQGNTDDRGKARVDPNTYGTNNASRLSYQHQNGPIPPGGAIRHLCGRSNCCNPEHLALHQLSKNCPHGKLRTDSCPRCAASRKASLKYYHKRKETP